LQYLGDAQPAAATANRLKRQAPIATTAIHRTSQILPMTLLLFKLVINNTRSAISLPSLLSYCHRKQKKWIAPIHPIHRTQVPTAKAGRKTMTTRWTLPDWYLPLDNSRRSRAFISYKALPSSIQTCRWSIGYFQAPMVNQDRSFNINGERHAGFA
jgi:hypothetical protein